MDEKMYLIPAGLLQGVLDYMVQQPWKDVANAVPQLMALKPVEDKKE